MVKNYYLYGVSEHKDYLLGIYNNKLSLTINRRKWEKAGFTFLFVENTPIECAGDLRK